MSHLDDSWLVTTTINLMFLKNEKGRLNLSNHPPRPSRSPLLLRRKLHNFCFAFYLFNKLWETCRIFWMNTHYIICRILKTLPNELWLTWLVCFFYCRLYWVVWGVTWLYFGRSIENCILLTKVLLVVRMYVSMLG